MSSLQEGKNRIVSIVKVVKDKYDIGDKLTPSINQAARRRKYGNFAGERRVLIFAIVILSIAVIYYTGWMLNKISSAEIELIRAGKIKPDERAVDWKILSGLVAAALFPVVALLRWLIRRIFE